MQTETYKIIGIFDNAKATELRSKPRPVNWHLKGLFVAMDKLQIREDKIRSIQEAVAYQFGLSVERLQQGSTRREVTVPRHIAIYLAKQMTDASLPEIGRQFGGKHPTTVMYAIAKIHDRRRTDTHLNHVILELSQKLNTGGCEPD
jgi:chromosomal replication initiation ATPase DnaA